ncbi:unnamed protein product [Mucor circinelloides]
MDRLEEIFTEAWSLCTDDTALDTMCHVMAKANVAIAVIGTRVHLKKDQFTSQATLRHDMSPVSNASNSTASASKKQLFN